MNIWCIVMVLYRSWKVFAILNYLNVIFAIDKTSRLWLLFLSIAVCTSECDYGSD